VEVDFYEGKAAVVNQDQAGFFARIRDGSRIAVARVFEPYARATPLVGDASAASR
jgi:hypothetical protein